MKVTAWKKFVALCLVAVLSLVPIFGNVSIKAADSLYIEVTGYQVSTKLGAYRTVYSLVDTEGVAEEVGLVYGLADYVTAEDMVVGSDNGTVFSYAATTEGVSETNLSNINNATSYVRSMKFVDSEAFYSTLISTRAYVKLTDGSYVYSDISTTSVYKIANALYKNRLMNSKENHDYLYENILTVVDPSYEEVEFDWGNTVIKPGDIANKGETTTEEPTVEDTTEPETTEPTVEEPTVEETTVNDGYTECVTGVNTYAGAWGYYVGADWAGASARYLGGTTLNDFSLKVVTNNQLAWGVQAFTEAQSLTVGNQYTVTVKVTSTEAANAVMFKDDVSDTIFETKDLVAGENTFTGTFTATSYIAQFFFDLGMLPAGTVWTVTSYSIVETVPETTVPTEPETTVPIVEETTTAVEITTDPSEIISNASLMSLYDGIDADSSSSTGSGSETTDMLFDNSVYTKAYVGSAYDIQIAWKMKKAVVVTNYTFTTGNDTATYTGRNPVAWQLYGSNDATTWHQIDKVTNGGMAASNYASFSYETDVQEAYQYYSIWVENTGGDGLQLSEISLTGSTADASADIGADLNKYYAELDSNDTSLSGFGQEVPANLFDRDVNTKMFSGSTGTIAWKLDYPSTIYSYTLTTANDNATYPGRNPKTWVLYGSTDGNNWTAIDYVAESNMADVNYTDYTFVVDKIGSYQYFKIDVTALYGSSFQLSEITVNGCMVSPSKYDILFTGDWDLITNEGYVDELIKLFYNSYPRLYNRWGDGSEPTSITFMADSTYDGVAYCAGTTVCVSTTYANANPHDIGFFSHEITHSVQQYGSKLIYEDPGWWTENMANYGGFRYFHWSNPKYVQVYEASDTSLQDWGWQKYGNNKWFFAYMDAKYPTTRDSSGNKTLGLIDAINRLVKTNTGAQLNDDPYDTTSPFNQLVYQITGYDCMESLRLKFVEELKNGTWAFEGFGNYSDNWLTEDIEGVDNPDYPMLGEKQTGNTTVAQLSSAVTSGNNLCNGASIYEFSGQVSSSEAAKYVIDGNLGTKWCATNSNVSNGTYLLNQVQHWVAIDLGSQKTFNTYTIYNTQSAEGYGNMVEWEVLISNDGKNWTSVDYQSYNNSAIASFNVGTQTARYVMLKSYNSDNSSVGTIRLYEFQLYNQ